jgi:hypothetical protein
MQAINTVSMRGSFDRIVTLASDIERWPEILPHYRWVTLLDGGGDYKVVEMAARRGRIPVKWRAIQQIDRSGVTPVISYRHITGPMTGMDVAWTFETRSDVVDVSIRHDFPAPWPVVGGFVADHIIGPHFVSFIAGRTLATIKALVEDPDPRIST